VVRSMLQSPASRSALLFETRTIHMGFVVYELALGCVFLRVPLSSHVIITPPTSLINHLRYIILATGSFVQYTYNMNCVNVFQIQGCTVDTQTHRTALWTPRLIELHCGHPDS
jgi:hypothetical protein